jgi:RNA polymerase sigma-70 factor (ECF subfamily)
MTTVATDLLFAEHAPALRSFLGARCRDPDLTADLLQETAARLVAAGPRLDPDGNPRGYLFRIAANVWRDHVRRELTRRRAVERLTREDAPRVSAADEQVLLRDLQAAVRRVIAGLPTAQREVLDLRQHGDLTFREIAERLKRPLGTVLSQMRAALQTIAAAVEEYR